MEALLLEVADGVVVGVGQEVVDLVQAHREVLRLVHQPRPVPAHLFLCLDGAESNFTDALIRAWAVADAADGLVAPVDLLDRTHRLVFLVEDQPHDIFLGHFRELRSEYFFQLAEEAQVGGGTIVHNRFELQDTRLLLLLGCEVSRLDLHLHLCRLSLIQFCLLCQWLRHYQSVFFSLEQLLTENAQPDWLFCCSNASEDLDGGSLSIWTSLALLSSPELSAQTCMQKF
mmetsp:Transcript_60321/g.142119  ORF Transcript_60321/g.142119 Transcript_60321/m.142119 type:complete len:229 (-) Transcript_60321:39-725(-)